MSRGPALVAGSKLILDRGLKSAQDRTIQHAWNQIRRNGARAFLVADAVGRGKSYMALGTAMGFWRLLSTRVFRIVIVAPTRELSSAWMKKLGDGHDVGGFSDVLRAVSGGKPEAQDYFGAYLPEFRKGRSHAVIYSVRTRRDVRRVKRALSLSEVAGRLTTPRRCRRIEVLITSPRFLTTARDSGHWRRWAECAHVVIADEAYGIRNPATAYGRLMRPKRGKKGGPFRHRPWLIALSATLLSRDMRDTESVLSAIIEWGSRRLTESRLRKLRTACSDYNRVLNQALKNPGVRPASYRRVSKVLVRVLRPYMSRMPVLKNRIYETWLTHQRTYRNAAVAPTSAFPFPQPAVDYAAVSDRLRTDDLKTDLSRFLSAATTNRNRMGSRTRPSWLRLTEIETLSGTATGQWPKPEALRSWLVEHIDGLGRDDQPRPRFKVAVYCHHVDTAKALGRRGNGSLSDSVRKVVRDVCRRLIREEGALFAGFYTKRTSNLDEALRKADLTPDAVEALLRRDATLLLAALLNARSAISITQKAAAFVRTLGARRTSDKESPILRFLQRNLDVRLNVLEELGCGNLASWARRLVARDKKQRAIAWFLFSNRRVRGAIEAIALDDWLDAIIRRIGHLDMRTTEAAHLIQTIASALHQDADVRHLLRRWNRDIERLRRAKEREGLERAGSHRTSAIVEVLTGENPERRAAVSQDFLTPGNPFLLVLTNVCSMGVDLHHYCWDVVHYSPSWTPSEFEQKSGRIDRPRPHILRRNLNLGEARHSSAIRIHHLIWPFTYDERVLRRMNIRGHMSERLLSSRLAAGADDRTAEAFRRLQPLSLDPH